MSIPEPEPEKPAALLLAEKWAKGAGKAVQWGAIRLGSPTAPLQAMLVVQQGPVVVFVRSHIEAVVVSVIIEMPLTVRQKIASLPSDLRAKMLVLLRQELLSVNRNAFALHPPTLTNIEQLERFVVEQSIVLDADDASTRNRFLDAIMEVTNGTLRAGQVLQPGGPSLQSTQSSGVSKNLPEGMFR